VHREYQPTNKLTVIAADLTSDLATDGTADEATNEATIDTADQATVQAANRTALCSLGVGPADVAAVSSNCGFRLQLQCLRARGEHVLQQRMLRR
jgi:hypothetical protein